MSPTVYLVTGANRGIGLGLVRAIASRNDVVVFAGTRNPAAASDLQELVKQYPKKVHIVRFIAGDKADNEAAAMEIKTIAGRLDVVIANAGVMYTLDSVLDTSTDDMRRHFEVNTIGPLVVFQAMFSLLISSTNPKFVLISAGAGSITHAAKFNIGFAAYGSSKAAANYLVEKMQGEHENLVCFPIHPGVVGTDMFTQWTGADEAVSNSRTITVEDSVWGIIAQIDGATRESVQGQFISYDGRRLVW